MNQNPYESPEANSEYKPRPSRWYWLLFVAGALFLALALLNILNLRGRSPQLPEDARRRYSGVFALTVVGGALIMAGITIHRGRYEDLKS